MPRFSVLILSVAIAAACREPISSPRDLATERAAIDRTRNAYVAAWRRGDAAQGAAQYLDDGVVLYPNQPAILGRAAILDYFLGFFREFHQDSFGLTSVEIEIAGGLGLRSGRIPMGGDSPGGWAQCH